MSEIAAATVRITLYNLQCPDNFSEEFPDPEDLLFDDDDIESDSLNSHVVSNQVCCYNL